MSSDTSSPAFGQVLRYLEDELDFESGMYNDAYLDRRITARMRRVGTEDYDRYLSVLRDDEAEQAALRESLSINVTEFFRNEEVWAELRPVLRHLASEGRVDAWSAPCSDGREPYSLSMLAMDDRRIDADEVSIRGTDIDRDALGRARRGVYDASATVDIADELSPLSDYESYVDRDEDRFTVREPVRERVRFEHHDLIRDEPKSEFDLVMCRNLLIYIDSAYEQTVVETVLDSLRPGGVLVIGTTETLPRSCRDGVETVAGRHRIYRKQ